MKSNSKITCCKKDGIKKGPWTHEEDEILINYIKREGEGRWRTLPENAGLLRCGKSCRLRWMNYLRPNVKRGQITVEEEQLILRLHRLLGNRWSLIAGKIPGRTDNEIKNYWNTHLSKKLINQGVDPRTHTPLKPSPDLSQTYCFNSSPNYMLDLNQQGIITGYDSITSPNQYQVQVFDQNIISQNNRSGIVSDQFSDLTQNGDEEDSLRMKGRYEAYLENEGEDVFEICNNGEAFSLFLNSLKEDDSGNQEERNEINGSSSSIFPDFGTATQQSYYFDGGVSIDEQQFG